jgi:hypothetical protein
VVSPDRLRQRLWQISDRRRDTLIRMAVSRHALAVGRLINMPALAQPFFKL